MKTVIRFSEKVWSRIRDHHIQPGKRCETLSYVFARTTKAYDSTTILVAHDAPVLLLDEDCFEKRSASSVHLKKAVLDQLLFQFAGTDFNTLINIHDHWFDSKSTAFSRIDDTDDQRFDQYLRDHFEPMLREQSSFSVDRPIFNVSMVLCDGGASARLVDTRQREVFQPMDIQVIGDQFHCFPVSAGWSPADDTPEWLNRHRDFIEPKQQHWLGLSEVLLVGAGGLGAILAESLARLGVGALTIVDPDLLDGSNLNRFQGGCPGDVGEQKVRILARRLKAMFPELKLSIHTLPIQDQVLEDVFSRADFLIGGLDDDVTRYYLNAASVQYMLPYFDGGVSVETRPTVDFRSRLSVVLPGTSACLQCSGVDVLDWPAIDEAYAHPATLSIKQSAGYVLDRPEIAAPSVYGLNMACSAALMQEFTDYLCGWRPVTTNSLTEWRANRHDRVDRETYPSWPAKDCPTCGFRSGLGGEEPLPRPLPQSEPAPSIENFLNDF